MNEISISSGLDFQLEPNKVVYNKEQYPVAVDWEKTFEQGKYAYQNPSSQLDVLYFGERYMEHVNDEQTFVDNDFMADLTIINPGKVGNEYIKTVGHYHGDVSGLDIAYPEVYEAVSDGFEYLLQSEPDENGAVDVIYVITKAGDKIVMPPNWGHVSLNTSNQSAVEVDIQKRDNPNHSDYSLLKEKVGGAVYRTADGLVKNPNYQIKSLGVVRPLEVPEWGLTRETPLYTAFARDPKKFQFLLTPQDFNFDLDKFFTDITPPFNVFEI